MKNKITVGVIVHNEDKTLDRCLKSFYDIVDEVIVVHDGPCSDKSLEIAKRYTKEVFVRDWVGTCEGHFNFIKENAKNGWIMIVDPDEYFSSELRENLGELLHAKDVSCYDVYWPTYCNSRKFEMGLDRRFYKRIIFRKDKVKFEGFLHEKRDVEGNVKKTEYALMHEPNMDMFSKDYMKKKVKWADVASKMLLKRGVPHSRYYYLIKAPIWFMLYLTYYMIFRMYFLSGCIGIEYAFMYAKYSYRLNMNLYRGKR